MSWRIAQSSIMVIALSAICAVPFAAPASCYAADSSIVIENCAVFDASTGVMLPNQTILIRGDKIASVAKSGELLATPADATRIDGRGKYAIPGLIDAHVHVMHVLDFAAVSGDEVLPLYLAAGVTSVRSTGDEIVAATALSRIAAQRPEAFPKVFTCSPVLDGEPAFHRDMGRGIRDPSQVPAIMDEMRRWHTTTVKIYAGTARPVGRAIIDEAHRHGMVVTAHLGAYPAQEAVADGVDCLEHIVSVFDFISPNEAAAQPGDRGNVDLNNPICTSLVQDLAEQKTYVDPTLVVFRNMLLLPDTDEVCNSADNDLVPQRLKDFWPVYLRDNGCPQGGGAVERRQRVFKKYQELTGMLHRAGVPLLVGTDSPEPYVTPGFSLHQELELLVESGLSPAAALSAATLTNSQVLGQSHRIGSIAPEKQADIVLLNADPLACIRNSREIELVIRDGVISRPADLLKLVPKG